MGRMLVAHGIARIRRSLRMTPAVRLCRLPRNDAITLMQRERGKATTMRINVPMRRCDTVTICAARWLQPTADATRSDVFFVIFNMKGQQHLGIERLTYTTRGKMYVSHSHDVKETTRAVQYSTVRACRIKKS